jgi:multisubunit Na+/H+ antiporter MnhE subunit
MSDLTITWAAIALAAIIGVLAIFMERRPYVPGKVWYFPYRALWLLCVLIIFLAAAHLITLYTGLSLPGRTAR